jgi:hypothetical protein
MASIGLHCMEPAPHILRARLADYVRRQGCAKTLARTINCDVRTAENIRSGHWPNARHWAGIVAAFGRDVTDAVFHPDAAAARLEAEVRELEQQLAARRAALRDVAGALPGRSQAVAALENRTPAHRAAVRPSEARSVNPNP